MAQELSNAYDSWQKAKELVAKLEHELGELYKGGDEAKIRADLAEARPKLIEAENRLRLARERETSIRDESVQVDMWAPSAPAAASEFKGGFMKKGAY